MERLRNRLSSCSRTQVIPQPGGRPVILSSSGSFVHDVRGRMTDDGMAETEMNYNLLDLPRSIVNNNTTLVKYSYLVDGMKTSALKSNGTGLAYRGGMVFLRAADGALSFESAPFTAGRMTADGIRYHVTDHLGSVRAVLNGSNGEIIEASDYAANHRLVLVGISGEIADSGRTEIRIHGGRQEVWDNRTKQWIPVENPVLEKTYGCIRAFDKDMKKLKRITDKLSQNDRKEKPGQVTIVDDLIKTPVYENPLSLNIIDYSYREKPQEATWDMIIDSIIKYGYYSAGQ